MSDTKREMLRHTIATVAYRGGKILRDVPSQFAEYRGGTSSRSAGEILAHIGDLFDWALTIAKGQQAWDPHKPTNWEADVDRFFKVLSDLDVYLGSTQPLAASEEKIFQGPVADALNHFGQLAMLRRMAGYPIRGENYFVADIIAGRVGKEQSPARREFD